MMKHNLITKGMDRNFMKFINKIGQFMYGRYGSDDLYKFLIKIYILLFLVNIFINNKILVMIELLVFIVIVYRFLSKNKYMRNKENQAFLKVKKTLLKPFTNLKRKIKDKNHLYKKCPKCKTILKLPLPSKRGIKHVKCPDCGKRITMYAYRYQKIEIIKNKRRKK